MDCPFEQMKTELKTGIKAVSAPHLFTTPKHVAEYMADMLCIDEDSQVLEPSAGTGVLIDAVASTGCEITACEINSDLADSLINKATHIFYCDFLTVNDPLEFDAVIMNPPFDNGQDIKHIKHAFSMLKKGGALVAICADGNRQRKAFADAELYEPLAQGTFKKSGTNVNTAIVYMVKGE
jgi:16S rRNA G1207 methylase RsmC